MSSQSPIEVHRLLSHLPNDRSARWDILRQFFAGWFGPLTQEDQYSQASLSQAEQRLGLKFPQAMREFYALAGRRDRVWSCQDHFLEPQTLTANDGNLIVCIENQGVVRWAIPSSFLWKDDPPVIVSELDDSKEWIEEAPTFSCFILSQMLLNAKFSAANQFFANGQATDEALAAIAQHYQRLDVPDLHWPPYPTRFFGGTDVLIETEGETWIWVGGTSRENFLTATQLVSAQGVEWEQLLGL